MGYSLEKLSLASTQEAIRHNFHTNVEVKTGMSGLVYIESPKIISLAFDFDGIIKSETIVNSGDVKECILEYMDSL